MKTILVLILAFLFMGAAGQNCPGVRFLPVETACRWASGGKRLMYDMCMDTLREDYGAKPSISVEITEYALVAAQRARDSYLATADDIAGLFNGSLDGDQRAAYADCLDDYGSAEDCMHRVASDMLPGCSFGGLVDEYMNGLVHLESCRTRLIQLGGSPVYSMNLVDRNKHLLAFSIANLLNI